MRPAPASAGRAWLGLLPGVIAAVVGPALVSVPALFAGLEGKPGPMAFYVVAVVAATLAGGLAGGLLAALLSFLAYAHFYAESEGAFAFGASTWVALAAFVAATVVVSRLHSRERALRAGEQSARHELEFALEAGALGAWTWDVESGEVRWSETLERLHGLAPGSFGGTFGAFQHDIHPDDRDAVLERIRGTVEERERGYEVEYRIVRTDGEVRWLRARGRLLCDRSGAPVQLTGVCSDVTDAKTAELERERLLAQIGLERERLETVLRQMPAGVVIAEAPSGRILLANDQMKAIWRASIPLGEPLEADVCFHADGRAYAPEEWPLARSIRDGEVVIGEELEIVRGGSRRGAVRASSAPVRDEQGRIVAGVATLFDITEARQRSERDRFLAEASELLSGSLKYRGTLSRIARMAVPLLADLCSVELVEDGEIRNVAVVHTDPEKVRLAKTFRRRYPPRPGDPRGVANVIRAGRSELIAEIRDPLLVEVARDAEHLELARSLGLRSAMIVPLIARGRTLGAITFAWAESARRYGPDDLALAEELARRAGLAVDNARLYQSERAARAEAERAALRIARLQDVTARLSEAATSEEVAAAVAEEGLAALGADAAAVYRLVEDGSVFERLAVTGYAGRVTEEWRRFPADMPGPASEAVRTGEVVALESADELRRRWPHLGETQEQTGDEAVLCAPLLVGERVLGVLYMAFRKARRFGDELDVFSTLARQGTQALERARLYELERETRARALRLARHLRDVQDVIDTTLAPAGLDDLLGDLLERLRAVLATDTATILIRDEQDDTLMTRAAVGLPREAAQRVRIAVGEGFSGRIAATQEHLVVEDTSGFVLYSPILRKSGVRSLAGVPLIRDGQAVGVLHVGSFRQRTFTEDDIGFLRLVADRAAIAIERAQLYEREHRIAETLQRSLLPQRLPQIPGIETAARYLPGSAGIQVGGDWYDVMSLDEGHVGLVVGDVVGRGIPAAAAMGQLRYAFRTYAFEGYGPAAAIRRLNRIAEELHDGVFATLAYLVVDPAHATVRLAVAGHPPPLVIGPDGSTSFLEGGRSLPLGVTTEATYEEATVQLEPGSTLILYTDGLVERRSLTLDEGLQRLEQSVAEPPDGLEELLDRVLASLDQDDERSSDDIAVVAVRLPAKLGERLELRLPAEPESLVSVRSALRSWLAGIGATPDDVHDVTLACNEACANAIEHPRSPSERAFEVEAEAADGEVSVTVRDFGQWRPPLPNPDRGRGMTLMEAFAEDVEVKPSPLGTEVRLRHRVGSTAPV